MDARLICKDIWQIIFIITLENCPALLRVRRDGCLPFLLYQPISRNVSGQNKRRKRSVTICICILLTFKMGCLFMLIGL